MSGKLFAFNVSKPISTEYQAEWQGSNKAMAGYAGYCTQGGAASTCYLKCSVVYNGAYPDCILLGPPSWCFWYTYKCDYA